MPSTERRCTLCILPATFPNISFDEQGRCNYCRKAAGRKTQVSEEKLRYKKKFTELLAAISDHPSRRARPYDILMAYSGGKDSTYTLCLLKRQFGLRVLALSFDNGFVSETAMANIRRVTGSLGVDHILFAPRWDALKQIFSASAREEFYPGKALERASTICTSCMGIVKSVCLKTAIEMDIPMIGYGWSPGQAPLQSSIMKNNPALAKAAQRVFLGTFAQIAGGGTRAWFLNERHYRAPGRFPYNIHPMAWEPYNEETIFKEIEGLGWIFPEDTDSNSTNCLLNALGNHVHLEKYGFHPYIWEISNMVRDGIMTREEGFRKFSAPVNHEQVKIAKRKLGLAEEQ